MATKTVRTAHSAAWSVKGKGKSRTYGLAIKAGTAKVGDRFKATSQAGVVTTGVLDTLESTTDGLDRWTFIKDAKTPEQSAHDRALRAQSTAAYWASDKGTETAARIAARQVRLSEGDETTSDETTSEGGETTSETVDIDAIVRAAVAAALAQVQVSGEVPTISQAHALVKSSVKAPPVKSVPVKSSRTPMATTAQRKPCQACGKQDRLTSHKAHPALHVCASCLTADGDTVAARALRRAAKLTK